MLSILKAMFISIVFIIIIHYFYNYLLNHFTKPIQINVYDELDHKYNKMYSTIYKNDINDNNNNNNNEHEQEENNITMQIKDIPNKDNTTNNSNDMRSQLKQFIIDDLKTT
jgi:H+/gluconate symporter-like permease